MGLNAHAAEIAAKKEARVAVGDAQMMKRFNSMGYDVREIDGRLKVVSLTPEEIKATQSTKYEPKPLRI